MRTKRISSPLLAIAVAAIGLLGAGAGRQDNPAPLSAAHATKPGETNCTACHIAPGKIGPDKCLACHSEIASRIAAQKGYHRDKGEACAVCHAEHQGRQTSIVPLDPAGFDHSETGAELGGAHRFTQECGTCHTPANTLQRSQGRSFLFKAAGCRGCHKPPHPGRQENCLACHGQDTWSVDRRPPKG